MHLTYGLDLVKADDKYFNMAERIAEAGVVVSVPGRFPAETIPILRYLPSWFPGGGFKIYGKVERAFLDASLTELYKAAVDGIVSLVLLHRLYGSRSQTLPVQGTGTGKDSFVSELLNDASGHDLQGGDEDDLEAFIKHMSITVYSGTRSYLAFERTTVDD